VFRGRSTRSWLVFAGVGVLGVRLWPYWVAKYHGGEADLHGAMLVYAPLRGAFLESADLNGADLAGATLAEAKMLRVDLQRAARGFRAPRRNGAL
jgi:uncharacterized protein YjbI with pentapeptide repeats